MKPRKKPGQKVFAFIDAENVRNSVEVKGYKDLNYERLYDWLKNKKNVERIYLYVGIETGNDEKDAKFTRLQQLGFNVYKKRVMTYFQKPIVAEITCKKCGNKTIERIPRYKKQKANCDADLTLDVINCGVRRKYKEIIVFSGDGDFARVYEYVALQLKKKVTVYSPFDYRTAVSIKKLHEKRIIELNNLYELLDAYGEKNYK